MKFRTLLALGLLSAAPSILQAQPPDVLEAVVASIPPTPPSAPVPRLAELPPTPLPPQLTEPPMPPQAPASPKVTTAPAPPTPPAAPVPPRPAGQMINVRVDVTLSDSKGVPKTLTMTVADGESGMNRTKSIISGTEYSFNADARPYVMGNKIRLRLTADAVVLLEGGKSVTEPGSKLGLSQSQTVILNDGETVEIARAADPVSERAFILTVKVAIQR